jgi:hypothetical protein
LAQENEIDEAVFGQWAWNGATCPPYREAQRRKRHFIAALRRLHFVDPQALDRFGLKQLPVDVA